MAMSRMWARAVAPYRYPYHFRWMGQPIIQVPQDILAMQELIFQIKPRAIIETGIARGGSAIFYASMLALLGEGGFVVGVDVDIRAHNREAIEAHPMAKHIKLVQGSSIDPSTVAEVRSLVGEDGPVIVALDSNHTKEHVLEELRAYSGFVKKGSYLVVFDTLLEDLPAEMSAGRPWGPGNGPKSAVEAFLAENDRFVIDDDIDAKLLITVAPRGWLRCVKDPS
jgi:cephalosporin hydroxylase